MKLLMVFFTLVGLFNVAPVHGAETDATVLTFLSQGKKIRALSLDSLKRDVPPEQMEVYEPLEKSRKKYRGFSVLALLKKIYGAELDKADTLAIYCSDGYRADIAIEEFKKMKALLAFAVGDGSKFTLKSGQQLIPLGPYYLVWDHPDAESAKRDVYRWPYAVNKMDLVQRASAYAPLQLKETTPELTLGQQSFMNHCFSCHTLNGVGGVRGPALDAILTTQENTFLIKYILDPQGMNKNSRMSGLVKDLKDRDKIAQAIVNYGKKVSRTK